MESRRRKTDGSVGKKDLPLSYCNPGFGGIFSIAASTITFGKANSQMTAIRTATINVDLIKK